MDKKNRRLFVGCDNKMTAVVDADSGKVLATPAIGDGVDATAFDDGTGLGFRIVRGRCAERNSRRFAGEIQRRGKRSTQAGARTMALDSKTHNVYVVTAKFGPPPAATADNPHPRRSIVPDSFVVLVLTK